MFDAQRRECLRDARHRILRVVRRLRCEGIDAARAEVALRAQLVLAQVAHVLLRVGIAAMQALLLVGERDHADRAGRSLRLRQRAYQVAGGHRDRNAGTIVDRAGAKVPRIQVAPDHHHLVRLRAPGDLADHVLRGVRAVPAAVEVERDLHRSQRHQPRQLVGVRQ